MKHTAEYWAKESLAKYLEKVSKSGESQEWITEAWKEDYINRYIQGFREGEVKACKECIKKGVITLNDALETLKMDKDEFLAFPD